jgi:RHS repeat-associated protein
VSSTNVVQTRYVWGDAQSQLLARVDTGPGVRWYLTDRLGSVRDVTDGQGAGVLDHLEYDGFGTIVNTEASPAAGGRYTYAAYAYDRGTGLYHTDGREDQAPTGTWNQEDPIYFTAGDPNLHRYVGNDATNATDPSGLWAKKGVIAVLKQTPDGLAMLKKLAQSEKDGKLKIFKADLRYKYTYDEKAEDNLPYASPETNRWTDTMAYGFAWKGTIYLHNDMDDFIAAWTIIHEGTHFYQKPRKDYSREENIRIEYEAFVAEAKWLLQKQEWITEEKLGKSIYACYVKDEEFFKKEGEKYVINLKGIEMFIIRVYIDRKAKKGYRQTKYAYEGPPVREE